MAAKTRTIARSKKTPRPKHAKPPAVPAKVDLDLLHDLCDLPTAAFREERVYEYVRHWLRKRPQLQAKSDAAGNLLLTLPGTDAAADRRAGRLILVAHTDHPAFVALEMRDKRELYAEFRGGVTAALAKGAKVRFFTDAGEVTGTIREVQADPTGRLVASTLRVKKNVPPQTVGMFDQGRPRVKKKTFYARACDDLAGVASALATLDELRRRRPKGTVGVLLTRAEEVGFVGALSAVIKPGLLKKSDKVISIETSAEQPVAVRGNGVVLRVGDFTSVFHSAFSDFLHRTARTLADSGASGVADFRFQRALMPGGTCEATVFDTWGYTTAAVCVPLGNYHNMDKPAGTIGPEYVSVDDWRNMVQLFVGLARTHHEFTGRHDVLKERLTERFDKARHLFAKPGTLHGDPAFDDGSIRGKRP